MATGQQVEQSAHPSAVQQDAQSAQAQAVQAHTADADEVATVDTLLIESIEPAKAEMAVMNKLANIGTPWIERINTQVWFFPNNLAAY